MKTISGDLIHLAEHGHFDVIVHGCNCFHTMGAGLARQIKNKWPMVLETDKKTPFGLKTKLGSISYCSPKPNLVVVNAYTQFAYASVRRQTNYDALKRAFEEIADTFPGMRIGYPKIGAGLGGGDWEIIAPLIEEALKDHDHTLVLYKP